MLSIISLQVLVKNGPVNNQNHLKHWKYISIYVTMDSNPLLIKKFRESFFLLKINKSLGADNVSFNIIKKCLEVFFKPLIFPFQLSLKRQVFSEEVKIAKITAIYKAGESNDISNCRPVSVLLCFSEILKRLMYNCIYKYLKENNIIYEKQFDFQRRYPTNNAIAYLVDKILNPNLKCRHYTEL